MAAEHVWVEVSTKEMMACSVLKTSTLFLYSVSRNPLSEFIVSLENLITDIPCLMLLTPLLSIWKRWQIAF